MRTLIHPLQVPAHRTFESQREIL